MPTQQKRLLVLYAANSVFTATVRDYLESFQAFSSFQVYYANAVQAADVGVPLDYFDAVFVHYSVRLCFPDYISSDFVNELVRFGGPKILSIQDEYENTEQSRTWIEKLQFNVVLTCVPTKYIENIYPKSRFPNTEFINVLTGYVPQSLLDQKHVTPIAGRKLHIGYRGRRLHYFYGELGREKELIGTRVKELCKDTDLKVDIEINDENRIYGAHWFEFIKSCKCMLGTESGANVFDFDGSIRKKIDQFTRANPSANFYEVQQKFLKDLEGQHAKMNQVSPKVFEAIACGTALVLFEGQYSSVLMPNLHFIPLKKDFSNWEDVVAQIRDDGKLQSIADNAYRDVILSGSWDYKTFVQFVDKLFLKLIVESPRVLSDTTPVFAIVGIDEDKGMAPNCFTAPVSFNFIQDLRVMPSDWKTRMAMRGLHSDFNLKKPGEWIRLAWVLFVPAKTRSKVDGNLKATVRKILRID